MQFFCRGNDFSLGEKFAFAETSVYVWTLKYKNEKRNELFQTKLKITFPKGRGFLEYLAACVLNVYWSMVLEKVLENVNYVLY